MEIVEADCAGACYGVQRALDLAEEASQSGQRAQTLGPLIHNPQVVRKMEQSGITEVDRIDDIDAQTIIIRSHGVTPQIMERVRAKGVHIIDATCPFVVRAQQAAAELAEGGYNVVVVGEASHPEVEGLRAYAEAAGGRVEVVVSPDKLPDDLAEPVGIVVQTTQARETLEAVVERLRARGIEPVVKDTICSATKERQQAAADLAATVDAMVVIGGHNSSNTTRLFEICEAKAPAAYHIETADELDPRDFSACKRVGVTAGASTPEDQIQAVMDRLRSWS